MAQVSSKLRRVEGGYSHWCPGCEEMHRLPDSWKFDDNLESPTFTPSFKHSGVHWARDVQGNTVPFICHYVLTAGVLNFCSDCTHSLAGKVVPLPDLPREFQD